MKWFKKYFGVFEENKRLTAQLQNLKEKYWALREQEEKFLKLQSQVDVWLELKRTNTGVTFYKHYDTEIRSER